MPGVIESLNQSQLEAGLEAGLDVISQNQVITFTRYVKLILPADGFVFWVRSDLVAKPPPVKTRVIRVKGSLHRSSSQVQAEDGSYAVNRIVFTSQEPVDDFNDVSPTTMYLGEIDGVRFGFNSSAMFYKQAGIYHYVGDAIYPMMESQIIDDPAQLDGLSQVVSNSLPIWLTLDKYMPLYPSYLVPDNIRPPYASVHIEPTSTLAIAAGPLFTANSSQFQLVQERARITIYGLRNMEALAFQAYVLQFALDSEVMGVTNMPVIRDEKRAQSELSILGMKKTIEFDVNYYQSSIVEIARKYILSCIPTYIIGP